MSCDAKTNFREDVEELECQLRDWTLVQSNRRIKTGSKGGHGQDASKKGKRSCKKWKRSCKITIGPPTWILGQFLVCFLRSLVE